METPEGREAAFFISAYAVRRAALKAAPREARSVGIGCVVSAEVTGAVRVSGAEEGA